MQIKVKALGHRKKLLKRGKENSNLHIADA